MASDFAARMAAARAAKSKSSGNTAATRAPASPTPRKLVPVKKTSSKGGHGVVKQIELGGSSYPEDAAEPGVATVHVQHGGTTKASTADAPTSADAKMSRIHMASDEARAFRPGQKVKVSLTAL